MTNSKTTKRALLSSVVALLLCFTMLLGTTFAWFTDSAASGSNVITAGNLDIEVQYTLDGTTWKDLDGATDLFQKGLWEPGHTEVVALRIKNNGTLALKYAANMNIVNETVGKTKEGADIVLSDILTVSTLIQHAIETDGTPNQVGDITLSLAFAGENRVTYENTATFKAGNVLRNDVELHPGAAHYLFVKVDMAESVGNEANHNGINIPTINFGINVLATQFTYEKDSFGDQYDAGAEYENIVDSGTCGGIDWTLGEHGTLTISPSENPAVDLNCGKVFNPGQWREAVVYNSKGEGILEGYNAPNASANEGGYFVDRNAVTSLVIEEGVTSIGSFAAQFPNLTGEVVIPASVTYIGQEAFQFSTMTKITFAKVPEGQTGKELCIAQGAFKALIVEDFALPDDRPVHVHVWQFINSAKLKNITFPTTLTGVTSANHVDYLGDPNKTAGAGAGSSAILNATNSSLETITFGSQAVRDLVIRVDNSFIANYGAAYITSPEGSLTYCKSLAVAAEHAQSGDTITLLKNTNEAVELPAGVTLNRNNFTADNVIVK